MGELFGALYRQIEANAHRAVEVYRRELPEYRLIPASKGDLLGVYDFAVFVRRRLLALAPGGLPLTDEDLSTFTSAGRSRAESALSLASQQQVLGLHTGLMLQEVRDASGPGDVSDLLRAIAWVGAQGVRARAAYLCGYLDGVERPRRLATRTELLARTLLADEPIEPFLVDGLGVPVAQRYVVSVLRVPAPALCGRERAELDLALAAHRILAAWLAPDEFVVLTPADAGGSVPRPLDQIRNAAMAIGRPCQVGSADGEVGRLAGSLARAREVSRVAPLEDRPERLYAMADLFVELLVAAAPDIEAWLQDFGERLAAGPSLVGTLHAYYSNDMRRLETASALNVHPRTLDYRLRRVRDMTGIDPGSTMGVRTLSAAVALARAMTPTAGVCDVSQGPADDYASVTKTR
jgi:PucR C-terminal helix-turn-helix domain